MNISEIKNALNEEYVSDVVDNVENVLSLISNLNVNGMTLVKDVIMSTEDDETKQLYFQSIFALNNIDVIDIDFVDIRTKRILPYVEVTKALMDPSDSIVFTDEELLIHNVPKSVIEMAIMS